MHSWRKWLFPTVQRLERTDPFEPGAAPKHALELDFFDSVLDAVRSTSECMGTCGPPKNVLEELEIDVLKDATGANHLYQLSKGTPIGVCFAQKTYEVEDPYIQDAPLRAQVSRMTSEKIPSKLVWSEKAGVLHLGGQFSAYFPVAYFPGGSVGPSLGFSGDVILRYRVLQPQVAQEPLPLVVPVTPNLAMAMKAGSEIELIGLVALGVSTSIAVTEGFSQGPAMLGLTAYASTGLAGAAELGVCVTALDQKGHVRLTVRRLSKKESSMGIGVTGGLMFQLGSFWASKLGTNSRILPNTATTSAYLNSLTSATTATIGASCSINTNETTIACIDLDLNQKEAQCVYRNMIMFRVNHAIAEAMRNPHCARIAFAHEAISGVTENATARFFSETMVDNTEKTQRIEGKFTLPGGEHISYVDSTMGKAQGCWAVGSRDVKWQEVNVQDERTKENKPYYRFRYEDKDCRFNVPRLKNFLLFVRTLGFDLETFIQGGESRLGAMKDRLAKSNSVEIKMDLFFSPEGVEKIRKASYEELQNAYFSASQQATSDYMASPLLGDTQKDAQARAWLKTFDGRLQKHRFDIFGMTPEIRECYKSYAALTGRSLSMDYGLVKQAEKFASMFKEQSDNGVFVALGKLKGFDFEQSVAALFLLAGRENARVNALSLTSGNIKFAVEPEKKIGHPQEVFAAHTVTSAAGQV